MKIQNKISTIFWGILIPAICILIATLNWWGCKTEEITGINPPPVTTSNLLGGRVILADYNTNSIPLYNVKVEIVNGPIFFTDSNGTYFLENIIKGKHIVKYSKPGFTSYFTEIDTANFRIGIPQIYLAEISNPVTIGVEGGVIHKNNMTLIIPAGSLSIATQISLSSAPTSQAPISGIVPLDVVTIQPANINFLKPITLAIATPEIFQNFDSISIKAFSLNSNEYRWDETNFQVSFQKDSIKVLFSNQSDVDNTINNIIPYPTIIAPFGYFEWTFIPPWTFSGTVVYETKTSTSCAGTGGGIIGSDSRSFSRSFSCGASILIRSIIELSVGYSEGYSQEITFSELTIPACKCINYTRNINKDTYSASVKVRFCTLTIIGPMCTEWSTFSISKTEYSNFQSINSTTPNNIPECHNQGGN